MSKAIITARDPGIIAAEINLIKKQVQDTVIWGTIQIGEKLCEAKSLVPQGEWGKWLEENVEYSQSTAENLMKLYKEYGGNQESLFDTWTNSETFGKLSYTQHLALLALPFADRQQFAEENSDKSTRQIQQLIKERDEARAEAESLSAQARDAEQNMLDMQQQLSAAKSSEGAWQKEIDKLKADKGRAEKSEANALKLVKELETKLLTAQTAERIAREETEKALKEPHITTNVMELLRKEAEAKAAEQTAGDLQKQLEAANAALAAEQEKAKAIEEKLVAAQKKADPEMVEFNVLAQKLRQDFNILDGMRKKITVGDKEKGEKLLAFEKKLVTVWAQAVGLEVQG